MEINNVIRKIRKAAGLTQEEFSAKIGIKRSLLGAYEEGRAEPRLDLLHNIAKVGGLTLDQVLVEAKGVAKSRLKEDIAPRVIPLVPLKAAAGYTKGYGDQEAVKELPHISLPMFSKGNYRAFEIVGDSMQPLASGTIVIGEQLENLAGIKNGKTYVLVTKREGIIYKRVFNYIKENGKLFLVSDNELYKPFSLEPEEVREVWTAKAYISLQFPDSNLKAELLAKA